MVISTTDNPTVFDLRQTGQLSVTNWKRRLPNVTAEPVRPALNTKRLREYVHYVALLVAVIVFEFQDYGKIFYP